MQKILILVLVLAASSCGKIETSGGSKSLIGQISLSQKISSPTSLGAAELAAASEVCNAFKYKRLNFPSNYIGYSFNFYLEESPCSNSATLSNQISALLLPSGSAYEFNSSYAGNYSKYLETDTSGVLANLCQSVLNSVVPSNSELVDASTLRQFSFAKINESLALVNVVYGTKVAGSNPVTYQSFKADQMIVQYVSSVSPSLRGMLSQRVTTELCPSGSMRSQKTLDSTFLSVKLQ